MRARHKIFFGWLAVAMGFLMASCGDGDDNGEPKPPSGGTAGAAGAAGGMVSSSGQAGSGGMGQGGFGGQGGVQQGGFGGLGGAQQGGFGGQGGAQQGGFGGLGGGGGQGGSGQGGGLPADVCLWCHGDAQNPSPHAPPKDMGTHTDPSFPGVGAHQSHLKPSEWHAVVQCTECHKVPAVFGDPAVPEHANNVDDIIWGPLAQQGSYDAAALNCTDTYCHGGMPKFPDFLGSVANRVPHWTTVDGSQAACGKACHTTPPGGAHPPSTDCTQCHGAVIATFTPGASPQATWTDPNLHINGMVEVEATFTCVSCHGDSNNAAPSAPPKDTLGNILSTFAGVGAHQEHLAASDWHGTIQCTECHEVPAMVGDPMVPTHQNGMRDLIWGPLAQQGSFDVGTSTCSNSYCHGGLNKFPDIVGSTSNRTPKWTQVDGTQDACGTSCHTTPPGAGHTASANCEQCHGNVIAAFTAGPTPSAVWNDPELHINGVIDVSVLTCISCHGDANNPSPSAPPKDTAGHTSTTFAGVGAHQSHLQASAWHAPIECTECHKVPAAILDPSVPTHQNGADDIFWGALAQQGTYNVGSSTCSGTYCHGGMAKFPDGGAMSANRTPTWTVVDGSQSACGKSCHTTPPGGGHTTLTGCPQCHGDVISSFTPGPNPTATWANANLHINGQVEVIPLTCISCHGDANNAAPSAPPKDTQGNTQTNFPGVGAHQAHLAASNWHAPVDCTECHDVPASVGDPAIPTHMNGIDDVVWGAIAQQGTFDPGTNACASTYCHGGMPKFPDPIGQPIHKEPVWTMVDNSQDACGQACHGTPPGGTHSVSTDCSLCHGMVISSFTPGPNPTATWANANLHINGEVNVVGLTCTSCHGDENRAVNKPAPPQGTQGELQSTMPAVGAHQEHLMVNSTWHRDAQCSDCHNVPSSPTHTNMMLELNWGPGQLANHDGAMPAYDFNTVTCSGVYCHGNTLMGPKAGGTVNRSPVWTTVNGTYDACGSTCHTNPPGDSHVDFQECGLCHGQVVGSYNPVNMATVWSDRTLHIDGVVESNKYHDLLGWTSPKGGGNHHGSHFFIENQQKDEHNRLCTDCHGANLDGGPGTVGVSCNTCHNTWRDCTFCHGSLPSQSNPPMGVAGETAANTLAVGDHMAHLVGQGFVCQTCHTVPAAGNIAHTLGYVPSTGLASAGHHGDVTFAGGSGAAVGSVWNVNATTGNPATARGSCVQGCHSNGKGGNPIVTPYWAGGTWTAGCGNCHGVAGDSSGRPNTGEHRNGGNKHGNIPCASCHPATPGAMHLNGTVQLNPILSYNGDTMTWTKSGNCGLNDITCTGTCHNSKCWN